MAYLLYRYVFHNDEKSAQFGAKSNLFTLTESQITTLELHFPYYGSLSDGDKEIFRKRLAYFMAHKRFVAHDGLDLFDAMKALVCAEAIKITFGLNKFILPHFKLIRIYPSEYYSAITQQYHKGEVDLRGAIVLAWNSFEEGIIDRTDGVNVAIHEFAHALYFENFIKNKHYLFIDPALLALWNELAEREIPNMVANENHFIRAYGGTNLNEFFAVSTEHFFEQPVAFEARHPDLYYLLTKIYNQNPAARTRL